MFRYTFGLASFRRRVCRRNMMARIVTQKPDPGNRVGLHYSPFQQSSPIRAPSIQLLARARSTQNRILEQPIREVGLVEGLVFEGFFGLLLFAPVFGASGFAAPEADPV